MNVKDVIDKKNIIISNTAMSKQEAIEKMSSLLGANGYISDIPSFQKAVNKREEEISTAVGYGVAIPHGKSEGVDKATIVILKNLSGIKWGQEIVNLVFMIAAPASANDEHLRMLSTISTFLMDETFRAKLLTAMTEDEIYKDLIEQDETKSQEDDLKKVTEDGGKYLIGISACMTGIAHTYMAAQSLENEAKKRGMKYKIQTNGSTGVENKLTAKDISEADAIVVAHDVKVDTDVFEGREFLDIPVKRAIDKPQKVVDDALALSSGYVKSDKEIKSEETEDEGKGSSFARAFYTHIMSGVSYMIPFVVVGGIFIAISFMFGIYASDPKSDQYNIWAAFFNEMGGNAAFKLYVPVLAAYISWSIADKPGLAPGMIGGMMAMNGGSGFLGGMLAGFLGGYITKLITKKTKNIPHTYQGLISVLLIPLLATFVVGFVMFFILNTPMSNLNEFLTTWLKSMNGSSAFVMGAVLAGMMSSDMGGPINKTASAFGLAMFASKIYGPSAALMVGGMVPPLGVALATLLFKNKFTNQEREAGKANWILGACFITEGAIPFAAADPLRTIPANVIGGAVGGALSMMLNITLQAPHGGIFVIPVACNKPLLYIGCILIGTVITALILGFTKRTLSESEMNKHMAAGII
ncbi:fructose-specific PTS transporter subunit EIIC [Companilactobacillus allii]|uniref:PTS fructose transporter subunit IIA n=1 Tax=Companilactobacillus allii TaxID=1847728 RepID=A0A1P8Q0Q2_9LACO|nr:fructose-specific PTS transporter subunit EIIC [Companilactobacillus allii]APX71416.1 PTS fructose transporter subunit IIA [Companilactobacillus allii]USQ68496.1 fructose-specific PTS transporter subunit EIIC [Companilactobacillus allii]